MTDHLPALFALLVAAAGWFYLFFSKSAQRLAGIEGDGRNRLRVRLRRLGGLAMLLLAAAFYATVTFGTRRPPSPWGVLIGGASMILLLMAVLVLALADLRLTRRFRDERKRRLREEAEAQSRDAPPGESQ